MNLIRCYVPQVVFQMKMGGFWQSTVVQFYQIALAKIDKMFTCMKNRIESI